MRIYQEEVGSWMHECFPPEVVSDKVERNFRFLEEALELCQSINMTKEEAIQLVNYVFNRSKGQPTQEVGGVMVTLAALCNASDLDLQDCADAELDRVFQPEVMAKVRAKHLAKPIGVRQALPGEIK